MCGFCAVFAGSPHWSELHGVDAPDDYTRRRVRRQRLQLVNALVRTLGCSVDDWHGGQYIVRSLRGRSEVVNALPEVWALVETIAGRRLDPLDPELLAALAAVGDA